MTDSKKQVEDTYKKLIDILVTAWLNVKELSGVNTPFDSIQSKAISILEDKIQEVCKECNDALTMTVWDKLTIAFFGVTNAGKSTIIETFRILFDDKREREDGLIVGDGRSDFTQTYKEYSFRIDGVPFTLIDVPGIEGNESVYKDKITEALRKAHIVFYIQGEETGPDAAIAEKIKDYLGDWVKVYSVYNVRGVAPKYTRAANRETLLTEKILEKEQKIKQAFKDILGDVYAGHITLQAFLAMHAKAEFSPKREDFIRNRQKLLTSFSEGKDWSEEQIAEEILRFSRFDTIVEQVKVCAAKFKDEISEANKQKQISLASRIEKELGNIIHEQAECINNLEEELDRFKDQICGDAFTAAKHNIKREVDKEIGKQYSKLNDALFALIDKDEKVEKKKDDAKILMKTLGNNLNTNICNIIKEQLAKLTKRAEKKRKDLNGISLPDISFGSIDNIATSIDFEPAIEYLQNEKEDVAAWIADAAAGAGVGAFGGYVGMAIGALAGIAKHVIFDNNGTSKAKASISKAIAEAIQSTKENVDVALVGLTKEMDQQKREINSAIQHEQRNLEDFSKSINLASNNLDIFVKNLKHSQHGKL